MVKIKGKNHHLAIAIKENYEHGMKPKEIANLFHLYQNKELITGFITKLKREKEEPN